MRAYGWSPRFCRRGISSAEAWVWYNAAKEGEATIVGALWERKGKGYIAQERDRLFEDARRRRK
jgi:hypothetical protein